jgi:hypothetical protein
MRNLQFQTLSNHHQLFIHCITHEFKIKYNKIVQSNILMSKNHMVITLNLIKLN